MVNSYLPGIAIDWVHGPVYTARFGRLGPPFSFINFTGNTVKPLVAKSTNNHFLWQIKTCEINLIPFVLPSTLIDTTPRQKNTVTTTQLILGRMLWHNSFQNKSRFSDALLQSERNTFKCTFTVRHDLLRSSSSDSASHAANFRFLPQNRSINL